MNKKIKVYIKGLGLSIVLGCVLWMLFLLIILFLQFKITFYEYNRVISFLEIIVTILGLITIISILKTHINNIE